MKNSRLYIPEPILALIVSYVSEQGIDALKNWIKAGHVGKLAAFSDETLTWVRLDKSPHFIYMSSYNSLYFSFYSKCLEKRNPYALYLHSLSLGFRSLDLCGAIPILNTCKDRFPLAKLLYIALNRCAESKSLMISIVSIARTSVSLMYPWWQTNLSATFLLRNLNVSDLTPRPFFTRNILTAG